MDGVGEVSGVVFVSSVGSVLLCEAAVEPDVMEPGGRSLSITAVCEGGVVVAGVMRDGCGISDMVCVTDASVAGADVLGGSVVKVGV